MFPRFYQLSLAAQQHSSWEEFLIFLLLPVIIFGGWGVWILFSKFCRTYVKSHPFSYTPPEYIELEGGMLKVYFAGHRGPRGGYVRSRTRIMTKQEYDKRYGKILN